MKDKNKNPFSSPTSSLLFFVFSSVGVFVSSTAISADYYIDSINGINSNSGSILEPWNSLDRIKGSTFISGDKIHLRRGSSWSGELFDIDVADVTVQNYGDVGAPLPRLEAMSDLEFEYVENFDLEISIPNPTDARLDDFSGKWFEQSGSGTSNELRASTDTRNGSGVSIKLVHPNGSSPQLSNSSLIALAADSELEYRFWIKVDSGQASLRIHTAFTSFYDSTGNWVPTNTPHLTINPTVGWQQVIVPVTTSSSISLPTINFKSLSAGTVFYLDDFTLSAKWIASTTPGIYKRLLVTQNVVTPSRLQVNGVDLVANNSLAELQALAPSDPGLNGSWVWDSNDRLLYMYFDTQSSRDAASIRINRTNNPLVILSATGSVIDGLRLETGINGFFIRADNTTVRNSEVDNMLGNAMFLGNGTTAFSGINISNNTVSTSGVGIYLANIHNTTVNANTVTNIAIPSSIETDTESIGLERGTNNSFTNNVLDLGQQGIGLWGTPTDPANSNILSGNIISNMENNGILLGGFLDGVANNLVHHNIIHSCGLTSPLEKAAGIRQNKNAGIAGINYYAHNVLYNNKSSFSGESSNYDFPTTLGGAGATANFEFSNNISINPILRHVQFGSNPSLVGSTMVSNNLFYPQERSGDVLFSWNGLFTTLNDFQSMVSEVTGSVGFDPLFVDAPGLDFHLQAQSPAIEVGASLLPPAINSWQTQLGQPDIGVFEYGGSDTDADGLSDYDERCYDGDCASYDPYDPVSNPTGGDLNVNAADTDGDGANDGDEVAANTDPLNAASAPAINAPATGLVALLVLWLGLSIAGLRIRRGYT